MTSYWHARASPPGDRRARELTTLLTRCRAGEARARETVIVRFLPLAQWVARCYEGRGEPLDDLVQAASVGLIKALDGYSPERGDAFAAYARPMIVGEVRRHFCDATWRVHVPLPLNDRAGRVVEPGRK